MFRNNKERKAYLEGWEAFHNGVDYGDNPFDGVLADEWDDGWCDAQAGRDPE